MRHADDGLLRYLVQHAFVVALCAEELARAFPDDRQIDRDSARGHPFAKSRNPEHEHEPLVPLVARVLDGTTEAHAYAAVRRPHSTGAVGAFIAPIELCLQRTRKPGLQVTVTRRQTPRRLGARWFLRLGRWRLSMNLARACEREQAEEHAPATGRCMGDVSMTGWDDEVVTRLSQHSSLFQPSETDATGGAFPTMPKPGGYGKHVEASPTQRSASMAVHPGQVPSIARALGMQDRAKNAPGRTPSEQRQAAARRYVSRLTRNTLAVVMAGGRGERLKHLTDFRCKPATPFGGKFRIIDFVLSNCVNSGIRRISVMTQYKAHSLIQHIQRGWGYLRGEFGEFVEIVPAQQQLGDFWYRGTADSLYQNLQIIKLHHPRHVLVLAGDHIYKMDYGPMLAAHVEKKADITVGVVEVPRQQASSFGVMSVDENYRIVKFAEKPRDPEGIPGREQFALGSMGIYVFKAALLYRLLDEHAKRADTSHDFGRNIIPESLNTLKVFAYPFTDNRTRVQYYWRDVGTVDAFYEANMELVYVDPELNIYDERWPIWTYQRQYPPAKFVLNDYGRRGFAVNSMVSGGCIISGAEVQQSLLFSNVRVQERSYIERAVIFPDVRVGAGCVIKHAIVDTGGEVPAGTHIGVNREEDARRFYISEKGVALVTRDMLAKLRR
jgi:glucose-1-phosphate adenylyltransferase